MRSQIELSSEYASAIVEQSVDAIIAKNLEGTVFVWNAGAAKLFGYSKDEMIGQPIQRLIPEDRRDEEAFILSSLRRGEPVAEFRTLRLRKDGHTVDVAISVVPLRSEDGCVIGGVKTVRDAARLSPAEERLRLVVDAAPNAFVVANEKGLIILVNKATENLFGYERQELVGQPVHVLVPERFRSGHEGFLRAFHRNPETRSMGAGRDLFGRRKDGSEVPIEIGLSPAATPTGTLVLASIIDISARKRAEETFRLIVDAAPNAIVVVNEDGRLAFVNKAAEKLFLYGRQELIGQPVHALVPERFRGDHEGFRRAFHRNPETRSMGAGRDLFGRRKDGSEVPIEIGLSPAASSTGTLVLASIIDISERKQAEEQLEEKRKELQRSNSDLEQFAYVASHDLQEPLRAISGFVDVLQKRYVQQLDPRANEYIRHAMEGCQRMRALIDDLLAFSRIGRVEGKTRQANCDDAVEIALSNLSAAIQESGAQVTKDPLPVVGVEPSHVTMLVQNLVGNAIKFRQPDRAPQVHVGVRAEGGRAYFSIRDNGIGIAPEHFERIFRVFQRLHTRNDYPGTGIGLAICKRIVEHHRGKIRVESAPGAGTTFYFDLPLPQGETKHA